MTSTTPENILKTARALFGKFGLKGVSVRQICKEAGCNLASVSYHFQGKEELYRHCLEGDLQQTEKMMEILTPALNREDFSAKMHLFLTQFYDHMVSHADILRMVVHETHDPSPVGQEVMERWHQKIPKRLEEFVTEASQKGIISSQFNPHFVVDLCLSQCVTQVIFEDKVCNKHGPEFGISNDEARKNLINQIMLVMSGGIYAK